MAKIAIATPALNTYSETFIRAHIERLPAEVHVLSGGYLPTKGDGELLVRDFHFLQRIKFRLEQQLRGLSWNQEVKHFAAVEGYLRQHQIQAVLAEYGPTGVALMEVCEKAGIPLVVYFHGFDAYLEDVVDEYQDHYHKLFSKCASIVANSDSMKDRLVTLGAPEHLVRKTPCGVDTSHFIATSPDTNPPVLLAVGRFVNKKAPYLTVMAFHQASQVFPELRLVMAGDGPLWEACVRLSAAMGVADKVKFLGTQSPAEIAELMTHARGFVQHSLTSLDGDSESLGVVFLEAGASGLPVIATRHDGIPEVVSHGETGILVDEGDVEAMAEAMILLAKDPELAAKMGRAGRARVENHFSMERSIHNLWQIIEYAIADNR